MSLFDTRPERDSEDSATLQSQRLWRAAGKQDLDFESQRLRNRLRAKMFGVEASPIKIGRFAVLETVGSGGMGVVYGAYDEQLDRRVAVKLLRAAHEDDASIGKARMLREAQALAKLSHPNVVQVYEVGTFNDRVFLAMEFLPGPNLRAWLLDEPRPWRDVLRHFIEAGRGLAAAHHHGVIHRDFKPANLLFGGDGRVRVVDFGLARATERSQPKTRPVSRRLEALRMVSSEVATEAAFEAELTQTGEIMGTPAYMSPEQARHEVVDARSDQYSYCVALYEALFGMRPHAGRSTTEVLLAVAEGEVRSPPRNTKVPARIVKAIMRGLATDPAERFPTMDALLDELSLQERGRWRLLGAGGLAVVGLGAFMFTGEPPCPSYDDALADAWGPQQRAAIEAAFMASRSAGAESALSLTSERLDAYASQWIGARRDVCEAHHVRLEQSGVLHDQRAACLDERRVELAALSEALTTADAEVVQQAPRAAAELTPISECADGRPHDQPVLDPKQQELRVRLAQAEAQYKVGRYDAAKQTLEAVAVASHEHEAHALEAAALLHRGMLHQRRREHERANVAFGLAVDLGEQGKDDELVARAWIGLAQGQAILGQLEPAEQSVGHANAKAKRLADDGLAQEVRASRAVADWQAKRFEPAIEGQRLVVQWTHEAFGEGHPKTADAELRLANILSDAGRHAEAQAGYDRAFASLARVWGPDHPAIARVWFDIGIDRHAAGRNAEATEALTEAERIFEASLGMAAPELAGIQQLLCGLALDRDEIDEADRRARKAVELSARAGSEEDRLNALSLQIMVAFAREDDDRVIESSHAFLEQLERVPSSPGLVAKALSIRGNLIQVLWNNETKNTEVERECRQLLEQLDAQPAGAFDDLRTLTWLMLGSALELRGALDEAAVAYRDGLAIAEAAQPTQDLRVSEAHLRWQLGRTLGHTDEGRALVLAARELLTELVPDAHELSEIAAWLD